MYYTCQYPLQNYPLDGWWSIGLCMILGSVRLSSSLIWMILSKVPELFLLLVCNQKIKEIKQKNNFYPQLMQQRIVECLKYFEVLVWKNKDVVVLIVQM